MRGPQVTSLTNIMNGAFSIKEKLLLFFNMFNKKIWFHFRITFLVSSSWLFPFFLAFYITHFTKWPAPIYSACLDEKGIRSFEGEPGCFTTLACILPSSPPSVDDTGLESWQESGRGKRPQKNCRGNRRLAQQAPSRRLLGSSEGRFFCILYSLEPIFSPQ